MTTLTVSEQMKNQLRRNSTDTVQNSNKIPQLTRLQTFYGIQLPVISETPPNLAPTDDIEERIQKLLHQKRRSLRMDSSFNTSIVTQPSESNKPTPRNSISQAYNKKTIERKPLDVKPKSILVPKVRDSIISVKSDNGSKHCAFLIQDHDYDMTGKLYHSPSYMSLDENHSESRFKNYSPRNSITKTLLPKATLDVNKAKQQQLQQQSKVEQKTAGKLPVKRSESNQLPSLNPNGKQELKQTKSNPIPASRNNLALVKPTLTKSSFNPQATKVVNATTTASVKPVVSNHSNNLTHSESPHKESYLSSYGEECFVDDDPKSQMNYRITRWLDEVERNTGHCSPPIDLWMDTTTPMPNMKPLNPPSLPAQNLPAKTKTKTKINHNHKQDGDPEEFDLSDLDSLDEQIMEYNRIVDKTYCIVSNQ